MTRIAFWLAQYQLKSKRPARRLRALRRLRSALQDAVLALDDQITIALLDHALSDAELEVRLEAADILAGLHDRRALYPLVRALGDAHESVQEIAVKGLRDLNDRSAIPLLVQKLFNGSNSVQWRACQVLKSLGWQPATEAEQIQLHIASGELKPLTGFGAAAVRPLVELLRRCDGQKKISAVNVLGELADPSTFKPLQALLRDDDPLVRTAAVYAFERAHFPGAAAVLLPVLKDSARNVRLAAALALGSLGDAACVEPLIHLLNDKDWEIRRASLESLGKLGDKRAFPSVARHLDDTDKEVREVAADALGTVGNESIVEKLVFTMVDAHASVRQAAQRTLNKIYPNWERSDRVKRLLPEIQAAMKNRDARIQSAAANLFQRLAGPMADAAATGFAPKFSPAALILRELLRDTDAELRRLAIETIGRMQLKDCTADLQLAAGDADPEVRNAAQTALGGSADSGKVTFLSPPTAPASSAATGCTQGVLLISNDGELLHEWNCAEASTWRQALQFILPSTGQIMRLLSLGDTRRVAIHTPDAQFIIAPVTDGCLMFRRELPVPSKVAEENSGAVFSETTREKISSWLRNITSVRGVFMHSIRFPDQTVLCDVESRSVSAAAIEESFRLVADAFHWLLGSRIATTRVVWCGDRTELHCAWRTDKTILGVLVSARSEDTDHPALEKQVREFKEH